MHLGLCFSRIFGSQKLLVCWKLIKPSSKLDLWCSWGHIYYPRCGPLSYQSDFRLRERSYIFAADYKLVYWILISQFADYMSLIEVFCPTYDPIMISVDPVRTISIIKHYCIRNPHLQFLVLSLISFGVLRFSSQIFVEMQERHKIWSLRVFKV